MEGKKSHSCSSRGYSFSELLRSQTTPAPPWSGAWLIWARAAYPTPYKDTIEKSLNSEKRKPGWAEAKGQPGIGQSGPSVLYHWGGQRRGKGSHGAGDSRAQRLLIEDIIY